MPINYCNLQVLISTLNTVLLLYTGLLLQGKGLVSSSHQRALSEGSYLFKPELTQAEREALSKSYQWDTSTQR